MKVGEKRDQRVNLYTGLLLRNRPFVCKENVGQLPARQKNWAGGRESSSTRLIAHPAPNLINSGPSSQQYSTQEHLWPIQRRICESGLTILPDCC